MGVRLWPQDFERKEHITKEEKFLLRNIAKLDGDGHFIVSIDPMGLSSSAVKMGLYICPKKGLLTYSIYTPDVIDVNFIEAYKMFVSTIEEQLYNRMLDSKILISRDSMHKTLKFPYKHVLVFPNLKSSKLPRDISQLSKLNGYVTYDFFKSFDNSQLDILLDDVRKNYDENFVEITEREVLGIIERLAPEYAVIVDEKEAVIIPQNKQVLTDEDAVINGNELEYKTFSLDQEQVAIVNEMGTGHRVLLANPGAGKSVLLLSKAFKYASLYKESKVLLTCYNNNLADSYNFKRNCANFGDNNNLYIMTFHKLVKKIYEECLGTVLRDNIATVDEIQNCINLVKNGTIKLRFKAIFIDEVQIFDPLYLQLCYYLLEDNDDRLFLLAGDLNQAVKKLSRRGDAPWKRIEGVKLDFNGRVKYVKKNYRNSKEIAVYIKSMLEKMNRKLISLEMISSLEYEYNSFEIGDKPSIALEITTSVPRAEIQSRVKSAVEEIVSRYKLNYSDIAILFPYKQHASVRYYIYQWIKSALENSKIPYTPIIQTSDSGYSRVKYSEAKGVILSTIDSSLGLDFKAVIVTGLYPYNFTFSDVDGKVKKKKIGNLVRVHEMTEEEQSAVQSQMRALYTACSRARDVLYVISDLDSSCTMDEILR